MNCSTDKIFLFDWGDTLMVDFPDQHGKMCDWERVELVTGAEKILEILSRHAAVYIATGAVDSSEADIQKAFVRAGISQHITGYFCYENLGIGKGTPAFFHAILDRLGTDAPCVAMVGDSLEKDIIPASKAGMFSYWLTSELPAAPPDLPENTIVISSLYELCRPGLF